MPSPFPGVDPYLEAQGFWPDFHASFITYWRDALTDALPDNYEARLDERLNLVELRPDKIKRIEPDLALTRREPAGAAAPAPAGVAVLEPATIPLVIEEESRETYIEILHRPNRTLVAVLELLSPSNKEEPGRSTYLAKRNALLRQEVHLLELDLLLRGQRLPLLREPPPGHFYAYVARADLRPDCKVYHWTVRQPLPTIPIPLKPPDADVLFDLAAVFAVTYQKGRYERSVDYAAAPSLPLDANDLAWALERAAGPTP